VTPTLLGNRYRLGERIAASGMGAVYRAVDETLGRQVAVKALRRELADDPTFLERFRREARAAAGLSHPGVAVGALVVVALVLLAWPLFSDESPTGSLAEPSPEGGGSSAGRAVVEVPAVVGLEVGEAKQRLRALGLEVDMTIATGGGGQRVRASSPRAGTPVERGTTVRLALRQGDGSGKSNDNGGNGDGDG
jgi:PASTA domain